MANKKKLIVKRVTQPVPAKKIIKSEVIKSVTNSITNLFLCFTAGTKFDDFYDDDTEVGHFLNKCSYFILIKSLEVLKGKCGEQKSHCIYTLNYEYKRYSNIKEDFSVRFTEIVSRICKVLKVKPYDLYLDATPKTVLQFGSDVLMKLENDEHFSTSPFPLASYLKGLLQNGVKITTNCPVIFICESYAVFNRIYPIVRNYVPKHCIVYIKGFSGPAAKIFGQLAQNALLYDDNGKELDKKVKLLFISDWDKWGLEIMLNYIFGNFGEHDEHAKADDVLPVLPSTNLLHRENKLNLRRANEKQQELVKNSPASWEIEVRAMRRVYPVKEAKPEIYKSCLEFAAGLNFFGDTFAMETCELPVFQNWLLTHELVSEFVSDYSSTIEAIPDAGVDLGPFALEIEERVQEELGFILQPGELQEGDECAPTVKDIDEFVAEYGPAPDWDSVSESVSSSSVSSSSSSSSQMDTTPLPQDSSSLKLGSSVKSGLSLSSSSPSSSSGMVTTSSQGGSSSLKRSNPEKSRLSTKLRKPS